MAKSTPVTVLTFAEDNCDVTDGQPPCILSQYLDAGHLVTTCSWTRTTHPCATRQRGTNADGPAVIRPVPARDTR